jgi:iron(III) transport system permease protein
LLPILTTYFVLGIIALLVVFIFYMSFVPGVPTKTEWNLDNWKNIARPYILHKVIPNTVIVGFTTIAVTTFFAAPMAWLMHRTVFPCRNIFMAFMASVAIIPGFVKTMGWTLLVNEKVGLINQAMIYVFGLESFPADLNNPLGMAWVMGLMLTPTMFFLISGPMQVLDPALEEAAATAGLNRWRTIVHISLPLVWPAILAGAIYNFMTAISIFEVPAMLGAAGGQSPVLATELFYAINPPTQDSLQIEYGAAGVYGTLISLPSLVALYFYYKVLARSRQYEVITGKGYHPKLVDLGGGKILGVLFVCLYLALAAVIPMLMLTWSSFLPYLMMPSMGALANLTFENYKNLLSAIGGLNTIRNTLVLVVGVSLSALFFSFMVSWTVIRTQTKGRKLMDVFAMLPHAIPGVGFAFALFIIAVLVSVWIPWFSLTGTVTIIIIANLLSRLAYGTRAMNAALLQVHHELEESARICGATNISTWRWVVLPLIVPALTYTGLWTAILTFREVTMALFLAGPRNLVYSTATWVLWRQGHVTRASAAAVVMVGAMITLLTVVFWLAGRRTVHQVSRGLS